MSINVFLRLEILELFRYKCVRCRKPTGIIHEIKPKSLDPKTWWKKENRVLLCLECHDWAHELGTKNSAEELKRLREQRLREYANQRNAGKDD